MEHEIWVGRYCNGTGTTPTEEPKLLAIVEAPTFKLACLLYELRTMLSTIEERIAHDEWVDPQSCRWFYDYDKNLNMWTGKYYSSMDDALASFNLI